MKESTKNMLAAFLMNLFFSVVELLGGFYTNSISIISDAVHDMGDCLSIGAALVLEKVSEKEPNETYTYGYARYSLLGALLTGTVLTAGSVFVVYNSVNRLLHPQPVRDSGMLALAVLGIAVNGIAALKTSHGHHLNERTLSLHMLEDVLGWLAVLLGSLLIRVTDWHFIDPLLSLGIAGFIVVHAFAHIKEVFRVFLERAPEGLCAADLRKSLLTLPGVRDVHHVHVWTLDGVSHCATLHVVVEEGGTPQKYEEIKAMVHHHLEHCGVVHATVELESVFCGQERCTIGEASQHGHHHYAHQH